MNIMRLMLRLSLTVTSWVGAVPNLHAHHTLNNVDFKGTCPQSLQLLKG